MISVIFPFCNQNTKQLLLALDSHQLLNNFTTTANWDNAHEANRYLPQLIKTELNKRVWPSEVREKISSYPFLEIARQLCIKIKIRKLIEGHAVFSSYNILTNLDKKHARWLSRQKSIKVVYGFEYCSRHSFKKAKEMGIKTVYELTTPYWRFKEELAEKGNDSKWSDLVQPIFNNDQMKRYKDEELLLADEIIVASTFIKKTITDYHPNLEERITIIPYGATFGDSDENTSQQKSNGKLKVLSVGGLNYGKGTTVLLDICERIGEFAEITIVGKPYQYSSRLEKHLNNYNYVSSLTHTDVLKAMSEHDVFLFPSLADGFGLVVLEAMAGATVVICSKNAGASDCIKHGDDGFLVDAFDVENTVGIITDLQNNRNKLEEVKKRARDKAHSYTWDQYRERISSFLQDKVSN